MSLSPLVEKPAPAAMQVNVAKLVMTCYINSQIIKYLHFVMNLYPK